MRFDYAPSPFPSWSLMVPDLKAAVLRVKTQAGIPLDAALAIEAQQPDDTQIVSGARARERVRECVCVCVCVCTCA